MKKALVVFNMQNDLVNGESCQQRSKEIIPIVSKKVKSWTGDITWTYISDSGSENNDIIDEVCSQIFNIVETNTVGYLDWEFLEDFDEIEMCGIFTDIHIVSNAAILRSMFPEKKILVDRRSCAGTSCAAHYAALRVLKSIGITIY